MNKQAKITIILLVGAITAAAAYYFIIYKPKKDASYGNGDDNLNGTGNNNQGQPTGLNTSYNPIGKTAYASSSGVKVLNADGTTYKTASKNEWIGTIYGQEEKGGAKFYKVSGNRYVSTNLVYVR